MGNDPGNLGDLLKQVGLVDAAGAPDFANFNLLRTASLLMNDRNFLLSGLNAAFSRLNGNADQLQAVSPPLLLGTTSTHFVVYSEDVQTPIPGCPVGGKAIYELEWNIDNKTAAITVTQTHAAANMVTADIAASQIPNKQAKFTGLNAFVYYFPKQVLFDYTFGRCKPSVTASDPVHLLGSIGITD